MNTPRIPSLRLLAGFEAAARLGSFSRAADELCLSQSAISHQVQQLEAQLGQPLFSRVGRGVELTVAGEVLLRSVQLSLDALKSGLARIGTYLDPGLVVLVCPAPLQQGWLLPRLAALQQALPGVCPLLSTDETARYVDELDVDINIVARPLQQPGLLEQPWLQDEQLLVASPALAQRLAGLPVAEHAAHASLLCLERALTAGSGHEALPALLAGWRRSLILDDPRLLQDAAERGLGVAWLSRWQVADALAGGRLQAVAGYPAQTGQQWWIARAAGDTRAPLVRQLYQWLLDAAATTG